MSPQPAAGGSMKSDDPPPPYPGYSTQPPYSTHTVPDDAPPPYPGNGCSTTMPSMVPVYLDDGITVPTVIPQQSACPQCQLGSMQERPDVALIMCLIIMAFLFTPLTLCCIPCAFREQCPNCGYSKI